MNQEEFAKALTLYGTKWLSLGQTASNLLHLKGQMGKAKTPSWYDKIKQQYDNLHTQRDALQVDILNLEQTLVGQFKQG